MGEMSTTAGKAISDWEDCLRTIRALGVRISSCGPRAPGVLSARCTEMRATDQVEGELFDEEGIDIEQGRDEGWLGGRTVEGGHGVWMLRVAGVRSNVTIAGAGRGVDGGGA